ncbi:uncharacterized protein BDZ99DRAFT_262961 [Mytilinidion resinicola]|uniref:Uncharacterized protein n=1 Tax=Mytilinidion resinicola TaxID=574789 RepID=A0A6A6YTD1_9PEZI|nr:uncharacterized protein BDZ99DRAFT_262961 [Mytilinidion resinicola]KAF2812182.1 hypothetical protein BDZ99DRAFT_262961 [Mytilinidion resinicola]
MALIVKEAFVYGYPSMPLSTGEERLNLGLPSWVPDFTYTDYHRFSATTVQSSSNTSELKHTNEPRDLCPSSGPKLDYLPNSAAVVRFSDDFRVLYTVGTSLGTIITSRYLSFPQIDDAGDGLEFLMCLYDLLDSNHDSVTMTKILKALFGPNKDGADACIEEFVDNLNSTKRTRVFLSKTSQKAS